MATVDNDDDDDDDDDDESVAACMVLYEALLWDESMTARMVFVWRTVCHIPSPTKVKT